MVSESQTGGRVAFARGGGALPICIFDSRRREVREYFTRNITNERKRYGQEREKPRSFIG